MKDFKFLTIALTTAVLALAACAKKDSNFAERYRQNAAGMQVVDGKKTQEAAEQAQVNGLQADVVGIQKNGNTITAWILVNNQQIQVTTTHTGTEVVEGTTYANNHQIAFHAKCANADCEPYFAALEIYNNTHSNTSLLIQEGVMKFFKDSSKDKYQWFKPAEALPFVGSGDSDLNSIVGYLGSSVGAVTNNGIQ